MKPQRLGILYPGAMGISIAASAQNSGHQVYWTSEGRSSATRERAAKFGLHDAGSIAALMDYMWTPTRSHRNERSGLVRCWPKPASVLWTAGLSASPPGSRTPRVCTWLDYAQRILPLVFLPVHWRPRCSERRLAERPLSRCALPPIRRAHL